jgi:hypothetical protein
MMCVVCESNIAVGEERYGNAWERSRARFPCCSDACAAQFDPDVHWLPGEAPRAASPSDEQRLVAVARQRLIRGDRPSLVARDLLLGGVRPAGVRATLDGALLGGARSQKENRAGFWMLLLTGKGIFKADKREVNLVEQAYGELDQWDRREQLWKVSRELGASARLR